MRLSLKFCCIIVISSLALLASSHPNSDVSSTSFQVPQEDILISFDAECQSDSSNAISNIQAEILYGRGADVLRNEIITLFIRTGRPGKYAPLRDTVLGLFSHVAGPINKFSSIMNGIVEDFLLFFEYHPGVQSLLDGSDGATIKEFFEPLLVFDPMKEELKEIRDLVAKTEQAAKFIVGGDEFGRQECISSGQPFAHEELVKIMNVAGIDRLIFKKGLDSLIKDFVRKVQKIIDCTDASTNEKEAYFKIDALTMFFEYKNIILSAVDKVEVYLQCTAVNPKFLERYFNELNHLQIQYNLASGADKAAVLVKANSVYHEIKEVVLSLKDIWYNFKLVQIHNTEFSKILAGIMKQPKV